MNMFAKVFGTRSQREVRRIMPLVEKIESLRPEMQKLSDEELKNKTREFKKRLEEGETLDDLLPEALLLYVRQVNVYWEWNISRYSSSVVSFLHQGRIAE